MLVFIVSVLIVYFIGHAIASNWHKEQQVEIVKNKPPIVKRTEVYYKSYCWNCGTKTIIDSRTNPRCSKCNKYYKCNNCRKCLCDKPKSFNNRDKPIGYKWHKVSQSIKKGYCKECGIELKGRLSHLTFCNSCYNKNIRKEGHCKRCGQVVHKKGYKLCYACWIKHKNK